MKFELELFLPPTSEKVATPPPSYLEREERLSLFPLSRDLFSPA